MSLVKAASQRCCRLRATRWSGAGGLGSVAGGCLGQGHAVTAAQYEPGKLNAATGALIGAAITGDGGIAERTAAMAEDVTGGYLYIALLVARVAGAILVEASG